MIHLFSCGGTIDKIYYDKASDFHIGEAQILPIFKTANIAQSFKHSEIMRKDSLDMDESDRAEVVKAVSSTEADIIIITHGTDSMVDTAQALEKAELDKTIVVVGAMRPALMKDSDADFNLGFALASSQLMPKGVYIAMNGQLFSPDDCKKNRAAQSFETHQ